MQWGSPAAVSICYTNLLIIIIINDTIPLPVTVLPYICIMLIFIVRSKNWQLAKSYQIKHYYSDCWKALEL